MQLQGLVGQALGDYRQGKFAAVLQRQPEIQTSLNGLDQNDGGLSRVAAHLVFGLCHTAQHQAAPAEGRDDKEILAADGEFGIAAKLAHAFGTPDVRRLCGLAHLNRAIAQLMVREVADGRPMSHRLMQDVYTTGRLAFVAARDLQNLRADQIRDSRWLCVGFAVYTLAVVAGSEDQADYGVELFDEAYAELPAPDPVLDGLRRRLHALQPTDGPTGLSNAMMYQLDEFIAA